MPEERYYADIMGRFNRGRAGAYAREGDYDRAAATVANDPALAESYAARGALERQRQEQDRDRQFRQGYAGAIASGDYEMAQGLAGKHGSIEGVTAARAAQTEASQEQRIALWRGAQQNLAELEAIEAAGGEGYAEYIARGRAALQQNPNMDPELRRLIESAPEQFNPNFIGAMRVYANRIRDAALTPEQAREFELTERQRETAERQADISERRAAAAERTAEAAMLRAERAGQGGFGPSGLSGEQVRAEREFARDWRNVYNNFAEIRDSFERIETAAQQGNAAGDLALVVAFTKLLDPGSVAREGEVALTQSAASMLSQAQNFLPRLQQGNTLLPPQVRNQFLSVAREMYGNYDRAYNRLANDYGRTADAYGFERSRVMMGYDAGGGAAGGDAPPMPPIAQRVHGQSYTMPDGGVATWNAQTQTFD